MRSLIVLLTALTISGQVVAGSLYIFVPTSVRANALEKSISAACPNVQVTAFGRVKDFVNQVNTKKPEAILSLLPTIKYNTDYQVILQGLKGGNAEEPYLFVSVDQGIDINALSSSKVGVIDILGRKPMKQFIHDLFGAKVKIKRVTKREDLVTLLNFNSVDAIFIPESMFPLLKERSNLNLVATPINAQIGLAGMASTNDQINTELVECISKLGTDINAELGVDQWKRS